MSRRVGILVLCGLALVIEGCGDNRDARTRTEAIGSAGGSIELEGATLVIPPDALPEGVEITVEHVNEAPGPDYEPYSPIFEFSPEGLVFTVPATITFDFTGSATDAAVFWTRLDGPEFEPIGGAVDGARIRAQVTHFSRGFVGNKGRAPCIDQDGDGYGLNCANGTDCDDRDATINPGAAELCNGIDDDCDSVNDDGLGLGDACGVGACTGGTVECAPGGSTRCSTMPGGSADASSTEVFDGTDNDCDGTVDDGFVVPGAPINVMATAGNAQSTVMWTPPASNGNSAITSYTVTSSPGGITATASGTATEVVVTGLGNGTTYTFTVVATNAVGDGPASSPSNAVTPATTPGAATGVAAAAGNAQATVSWTAPADNGGLAISGYTVTSSPGGFTATTTGATTATVTGLSNGTSYTFTVVATNAVGDGPASLPSNAVTAATIPAAPTNAMATAGNAQSTVLWTPPADNGGSAITSYTVTSSPGGITATASGSATEVVVTGLSNGTTYTFTVVATNAVGDGPASSPSNAVTPATTPGAATGVAATAGNAQATVSWTAPADNGGLAISGYTVTSSPGGLTATTTGATTATVTGLSNGTSYTFTVVATNAVGDGPASSLSNAVTPATIPAAPANVMATAANAQAAVSWSAPTDNGGSAITSYTVTSSPGGFTATTTGATTATVTGLTNGTSYTFTVVATNALGDGPASPPSNAITPWSTVITGFAATATPPSVELTWQAIEEPNVELYVLQRKRPSDVDYQDNGASFPNGPGSSYNVSDSPGVGTFDYQLTAMLFDGTREFLAVDSVTLCYCSTLGTNLVAHWTGDGTANDATGVHHGTLQGNTAFVTGRLDQTFDFDGNGDFVDVAHSAAFDFGTGDFSVAFWMNADSLGNDDDAFIHKDTWDGSTARGWLFNVSDGAGGVGWLTRDYPSRPPIEARVATSTFASGQWYHITGVRQANVLYLYVDGVLKASATETTPIDVSNTINLGIGSLSPAAPQFFDGRVDDVRIYSRALTTDEIGSLVHCLPGC